MTQWYWSWNAKGSINLTYNFPTKNNGAAETLEDIHIIINILFGRKPANTDVRLKYGTTEAAQNERSMTRVGSVFGIGITIWSKGAFVITENFDQLRRDTFNLVAEQFIFNDILQVIASIQSVSITALCQCFRGLTTSLQAAFQQHTG